MRWLLVGQAEACRYLFLDQFLLVFGWFQSFIGNNSRGRRRAGKLTRAATSLAGGGEFSRLGFASAHVALTKKIINLFKVGYFGPRVHFFQLFRRAAPRPSLLKNQQAPKLLDSRTLRNTAGFPLARFYRQEAFRE